MNAPALAHVDVATTLPSLIDRAVAALSNARTSAEVLEARDLAALAYDAAKRAARLGKAKQAHDDLVAAAYRAQADALEIEAGAKRRLADEYDAAQERGEIPRHGGDRGNQHTGGKFEDSKLASIPPQELHEARIIRDAEIAEPGVVRRTVDDALASGEEPTRAKVRRTVLRVVRPEQFEDVPGQSTPNSRFLNVAWDAEHRPKEFDFSAMTDHGALAAAAERVAQAWSDAARELRRLEGS